MRKHVPVNSDRQSRRGSLRQKTNTSGPEEDQWGRFHFRSDVMLIDNVQHVMTRLSQHICGSNKDTASGVQAAVTVRLPVQVVSVESVEIFSLPDWSPIPSSTTVQQCLQQYFTEVLQYSPGLCTARPAHSRSTSPRPASSAALCGCIWRWPGPAAAAGSDPATDCCTPYSPDAPPG